jgi:hypothetical protein
VKFAKVVETETGWSDWILPTPRRSYKMACCDCGLVHDLQFEAVEVRRKRGGWTHILNILDPATHWLRFRARRNDRLTAGQRDDDVRVVRLSEMTPEERTALLTDA